ncbi:SGNH/GDSL hydrolase family protein [Streptosporangium soli]|nr:hypothetical protein [Streptosporangium sp. KLBMP 9127]
MSAVFGAETSVSVEARRLIFAAGPDDGRSVCMATVNVRVPQGQPTDEVAGSAGLTVTFGGAALQMAGLTFASAVRPLVVHLAGDSTACDQRAVPYTGWGQMLTASVRAGAVVTNYAASGESSLPAVRAPGDAIRMAPGAHQSFVVTN